MSRYFNHREAGTPVAHGQECFSNRGICISVPDSLYSILMHRHTLKVSGPLIVSLLVLLCSGVFIGFFIYTETGKLQYDDRIIGAMNRIQGMVQRMAKLSLGGLDPGPLMAIISGQMDDNIEEWFEVYPIERQDELTAKFRQVMAVWNNLYEAVDSLKTENRTETRNAIQRLSERIWYLISDFLAITENNTSDVFVTFRLIMIVLGLDVLIVIFIMIMVQVTVKNRLEVMANFDALTRVFNRASFERILEKEIPRSGRSGQPLCLVMLDIDHFKKVNDTHGHKAGDRVLQRLSEIIDKNIRQSDYFCRVGGEEFAIVLIATNLVHASALAEKLRMAVENGTFEHGLKVTVSLGVAELADSSDREALYKKADAALYRAKEGGRNRVVSA
jgi:diguanylate cyclase (GGDEF)-like protein